MQKIQVGLACLLSLGLATLGFTGVVEAQTIPKQQNVQQTQARSDLAMGIIESVNNATLRLEKKTLLIHKVKKQSIVGIKVPDDIYYSKVSVFYDSTLN